jgi:predicted nucleic acid-binding Zn ribbon protein
MKLRKKKKMTNKKFIEGKLHHVRDCAWCGKEFFTMNNSKKTCSDQCSYVRTKELQKERDRKRTARVVRKCEGCKKDYEFTEKSRATFCPSCRKERNNPRQPTAKPVILPIPSTLTVTTHTEVKSEDPVIQAAIDIFLAKGGRVQKIAPQVEVEEVMKSLFHELEEVYTQS